MCRLVGPAGDLLGGFERQRIGALAEIRVGQIEFHVIGIGICGKGILKMQNCLVVQSITRQKHTHSGLRPVVASAQLIELHYCFSRVIQVFQVSDTFPPADRDSAAGRDVC